MPLYKDPQLLGHDASLIDVVTFLRKSYRAITLFGLLGLFFALIYLWLTPNQYSATTLIQMARIPTSEKPLGINVEEPATLIARMGATTSFNGAVISACGLAESPNAGDNLSKSVNLTIPKGLVSAVELKVTRGSGELAKNCAQSVFDEISISQSRLSNPIKNTVKARLSVIDERLEQNKQLLAKLNASSNAVSTLYFSILSEKRALEDERGQLGITISDGSLIGTQMQYPIEVSAKPVHPKRLLSLLAGVIGGLLLGLFVSLSYQVIGQLKLELTRK